MIIRRFGRFKMSMVIILILSQLIFGTLDMFYMNYPDNKRPKPISWLKNSKNILVDNVARGILPGIVWHLPDDKLIFAADQDYLLENSDEWDSMLGNNSLYISVLLYGNTSQNQQRILETIERKYDIRQSFGGFWGYGTMFRLESGTTDSVENYNDLL